MANRVAAMMEEDITESEAVAIMAAAVATTPTTPKTVMVKEEEETHHPYAFHVSGPRNVASPNWRDLISSSWYVPTLIPLFWVSSLIFNTFLIGFLRHQLQHRQRALQRKQNNNKNPMFLFSDLKRLITRFR